MDSDKQKINAVFDSDLEKILKDLGIHQAVLNGEIKCVFCGTAITIENLEYIFSKEGKIVISCNKPECKDKITEQTNAI